MGAWAHLKILMFIKPPLAIRAAYTLLSDPLCLHACNSEKPVIPPSKVQYSVVIVTAQLNLNSSWE